MTPRHHFRMTVVVKLLFVRVMLLFEINQASIRCLVPKYLKFLLIVIVCRGGMLHAQILFSQLPVHEVLAAPAYVCGFVVRQPVRIVHSSF